MTATASTAYSRYLGEELRRLREQCTGLNGHAFAVQLGWDPSKVSNVEHGKIRASEMDIVQVLTLCGKDIDYCDDFRRRYRHAFDPYLAQVPENLRTLAMTENTAKKILSFDVLTVPSLFQTQAYAREAVVDSGVPDNQIAMFVCDRMDRQSVVNRPHRPELLFYVHELALQLRLGDDRLMKDQYLRLLFNAHVLRVVPADVRFTAPRSKLALFEFERSAPVVFTETDVAQVFAQDDAAVERARNLFERLDEVALDEEQTKKLLTGYVGG